jgi:hypothetical protein
VYNTSYFSTAKVVTVCKVIKMGTRKKALAEGIFKEKYGLVGDNRTNVCEPVWEIATDGKQGC